MVRTILLFALLINSIGKFPDERVIGNSTAVLIAFIHMADYDFENLDRLAYNSVIQHGTLYPSSYALSLIHI